MCTRCRGSRGPTRPTRGAHRHLAELLPGREDRRARLQRRRQVDPAADHGRGRHRVPRRGAARPGATVGMLEQEPQLDESKDVRGNVEDGVARAARPARPLQRAGRQLLRRDRRRVRPPAGPDRRRRRLEPRHDARDRHGRAAAAARRRRRQQRSPAASAAGWRSAGCCSARPTCCCSTSRPTTSTPSRWPGSSSHLEDYKGTVVAVTHDRYFLDNVAGWILELDRGRGIPFKGNYSSWLEQKQERLAQEERKESARQRTLAAELEWVRENPKGRRKKSKARLARYEELLAEEKNVQLDGRPDPHPGRPAARRRRHRGRGAARRASGTSC